MTGLCNVGDHVLQGFCPVYMDDVIIFSKIPEDHLDHIQMFLEKLKDVGLELSVTKFC